MASSAFLSGVEVLAGAGARTIVAFGDSITDGMGSTLNANHRWPDLLAQRVAKEFGGKVAVVNEGISGNRVLHDVAGQNGIARFERDALSWPNVTHVIVLLGINDIGFANMPAGRLPPGVDTSPVTAEEIIAGHRQFIAKAHARGVKIIGATLTPYRGAGTDSDAGEVIRQAVNKWIRESGEYDGIIDFDAAVRDPANPVKLKPAFQSGDWIHPSDAGYEAMVKAIDLSLLK
jgi:lysophospholipase L1-like esterase